MGNWYGFLLVAGSSALFGGSSVVIKYTYSTGIAPITLLLLQNSLGALMAWSWAVSSRTPTALPKKLVPWMILQGGFGAATSVLFYTALEPLGAALATLLLFTYPAFVALYNSIFRGHRLVAAEKLALLLAFVGLIFCVEISEIRVSQVAMGAVAMALLSAVTNAFISINGERLLGVCETPAVTAWSLTFSTSFMFLFFRPFWLADLTLTGYQLVLVLIGALLFNVPLMIYLAGLKRVGSGVASIVSTVEIPCTLLLAWLFLGELLSGLQILGGFLIMISVIILYRRRME